MKIGELLRENQLSTYEKLNNKQKKKNKEIKLNTKDIEELMKHDSYSRHRGAMRQR